LDEYFNKKITEEFEEKIIITSNKLKTYKDLIIDCIEKNFNYVDKIISHLDKNIFKNCWVKYNIYERLVAEGISDNFRSDLAHTNDDFIDDTFKLIFRQPIRRY
jgi:hypothetical protein